MHTALILIGLVASTASLCMDEDANCGIWASYCTDPVFSSKCKSSCGLCPNPTCGTKGRHAVGPCSANGPCGGSGFHLPGYACSTADQLCCPTSDFFNMDLQAGPAVGGMCSVGFVCVYGIEGTVDPDNQGICVKL